MPKEKQGVIEQTVGYGSVIARALPTLNYLFFTGPASLKHEI